MGAIRCLVVLAWLAGDARADLRTAIANDFLAAGDPVDDDGFTNDIDVRFWRPYRGYLIGGELYDRWVTEEPRVAGRRRDLVELLATGERAWDRGLVQLVAAARGGPVFTGNLGGRWMQNAFHTTCGCGDTLDEGLQRSYERGNAGGLLVGTRARASIGVPLARAYVALDDQLALGTGVSFVDAAVGGGLAWRATPALELGGHVELWSSPRSGSASRTLTSRCPAVIARAGEGRCASGSTSRTSAFASSTSIAATKADPDRRSASSR
jgi:hypothetical protein